MEVQGGSESASVCPVWGLCSLPRQCFALGFLTSEDSQCRAPQASSCSLEPLFQRILAKASYRLKSQSVGLIRTLPYLRGFISNHSSRGHTVQAKSQPSHFRSGFRRFPAEPHVLVLLPCLKGHLKKKMFFYLFIWLCWVFLATCRIFFFFLVAACGI